MCRIQFTLVLLLGTTLAGSCSSRSSGNSASVRRRDLPVLVTTAEELTREFEDFASNEDEAAAREKYFGRTVEVTGLVIDKDSAPNVVLKGVDTPFTEHPRKCMVVYCNFEGSSAASQAQAKATLEEAHVRIRGTLVICNRMAVTIAACEFLP